MNFIIKSSILFSFSVFLFSSANSQPTKAKITNERTAPVLISMVNSKGVPAIGELVIFSSAKTGKRITGRTNAKGVLAISLPQGDEYTVSIKGISDSSDYTKLEIPLLKEGESFTGSFDVNIVYDPPVSFTLDHVFFDVGKASLRPPSFKELNELVEYIKWKPGEKIEIAGHTDNTGREADNIILSQKRAEAVRNYLVSKGISKLNVVAKGYGSSQPVADNNTDAGKQQNRRTEVRLVNE